MAQSVTYSWLLFLLISHGGSHSFFGDVQVVSPSEITSAAPPAVIYYLGLEDEVVHSIHPDGSGDEFVTRAAFEEKDPRLFLQRNPSTQGWDLMVCSAAGGSRSEVVKEGLLTPDALGDYSGNLYPDIGPPYANLWKTLDLSPGTTGPQPDPQKPPSIPWGAFEGSAFAAIAKSVNILPNGQLILQLVEQICLVDPRQKKIAYLAKGRGPLVVLEKDLGQADIRDTTTEAQLKPNGE
jgi:hypothetical protein